MQCDVVMRRRARTADLTGDVSWVDGICGTGFSPPKSESLGEEFSRHGSEYTGANAIWRQLVAL